MRSARFAVLVLVLVGCAALGGPQPASAQSFFQSLFGMIAGGPKKSKPAPSAPRSRRKLNGGSVPWIGSAEDRRSRRSTARRQNGPRSMASGYRTMCVRLCDGYYFPISSSVGSGRFRKDAAACESRCGTPARMYYIASQSDDIEDMRDLQGRRYGDLKTAFLYRKKLRDACTCRPMPWSASERARHARYKAYEDYRKIQARREAEKRREREAIRLADINSPDRDLTAAQSGSALERSTSAAVAGEEESEANETAVTGEQSGTSAQQADASEAAERRETTDRVLQAPARTPKRSANRKRYRTSRKSSTAKRRTKPKPAYGLGGLFAGGGNNKYRWPGD